MRNRIGCAQDGTSADGRKKTEMHFFRRISKSFQEKDVQSLRCPAQSSTQRLSRRSLRQFPTSSSRQYLIIVTSELQGRQR